MPSPTANRLRAIAFFNRVDGWAVGDTGTILRYVRELPGIPDGAWQNFPSGSDQDLLGVTVVSENDAWAVGVNGTILHYERAEVSVSAILRNEGGKTFFNLTVVFILDGPGGEFSFSNGLRITTTPVPDGGTYVSPSLEFLAESDSLGTPSLISLEYMTSGGAWIFGEPPDGASLPLILRFVIDRIEPGKMVQGMLRVREPAPKWQPDPQSQLLTLLPLHAVTFVNPQNGFAVGGDPAQGGIVLKYDGSSWVSATTTSDPLYDLFAIASDNVWFCGANRRLMHFKTLVDGTSVFTKEPSPVADGLDWRAIDFPSRSVGWVVGDNGQIGRYSTAGAGGWSLHLQGGALTSATLYALSILADDGRGYVVGTGGVRLHYNGTAFEFEATGGNDLHAVDLVNELEGAAVGGNGSSARILQLRAVTAESNVSRLRIYPNPYDPARGRPLTFDRLPNNVETFEIFTLLGQRVASFSSGIGYDPVTGVATWSGQVAGSRPAASGSYLYRMKTASGETVQGIFLVTRR